MQPIIFFIAETGVYQFSRNAAIFSHALESIGQPTLFIHCTGQLTRCAAIAMRRLPGNIDKQIKQKICAICQKNIATLQKKYNLQLLDLDDYYSEEDHYQTQIEVSTNIISPHEAIYKDIPIGLFAYRGVALETKDASTIFSGPRLALMQSYLSSAIEAYVISERIINRVQPKAFFYGQSYCFESVSELTCKKFDILTSYHSATIINGYDYGRILLYSKAHIKQLQDLVTTWHEYKNIPLTSQDIQSCWDDVFFRNHKRNSHIYSPPKGENLEDLKEKFSIDPARKTIIAYVSSQDERTTLELACQASNISLDITDVFENQVIWLQQLLDFVSERSDIQLIIRMHPRLGKDHRSNVASIHLNEFKSLLGNLPERCHVVWPQDPVSSYDLAELADLALVSWSTMGRELARIGIPVIATAGNFYYPNDDFIKTPSTEKEYFQTISSTLKAEYTFSMLQKAIRFNYFVSELPTLDLRDDLGSDLLPIDQDVTTFTISNEKINIIGDVILGKHEIIELNAKRMKRSLNSESIEKETIYREICYFIHNEFFPQLDKEQSSAHIEDNEHQAIVGRKEIFPRPSYIFNLFNDCSLIEKYKEKTTVDSLFCAIFYDQNTVYYVNGGTVKQRNSLLLLRLVHLLAKTSRTTF